jgi:opacity protein-like surface antigen
MKHCITICILILLLSSLSLGQGKIGLHVGYWSPSLDEINDGLRELGASERFSGNVEFGADYQHQLNEQWDLMVGGHYWSQTVTEAGGEATVSIIPIMVSALYKIEAKNASFMPYIGGGVGLGFVSWEIGESAGDTIDDTANPFLIQLLAGINYPTSKSLFLFAELGYIIGSFNAKNSELGVNEDVSVNGILFRGGIRFTLN